MISETSTSHEKPEKQQTAEELLLAEYDTLCHEAVSGYVMNLRAIHTDHTSAFEDESASPGTHNIKEVMHHTFLATKQQTATVAGQVREIITGTSEGIYNRLVGVEQLEVDVTREEVERVGVENSYYARHLIEDNPRKGEGAMRALLDVATFARAQREVKAAIDAITSDSPTDETVSSLKAVCDEMIQGASTPIVERAMRVALDELIFNALPVTARRHGIASEGVVNLLSATHSVSVLRVALDAVIFKQYEEASATNTAAPERILLNASTKSARRVFGYMAADPSRYKDEAYDSANYEVEASNDKSEVSIEKEIMAKDDPELQGFVEGAVAQNRKNLWLRTVNASDIHDVINTVKTLRREAAERGEHMSDSAIYRQYHAKANTGEEGGNDTADPRLVGSFQILHAMMGNHKGKLPF